MEKIKEFFTMISNFLAPVIDKIMAFFDKGWYIVYAGILILIIILVIIGLIRAFIKIPKTFILILIILAAFCTAAYFLIYKQTSALIFFTTILQE